MKTRTTPPLSFRGLDTAVQAAQLRNQACASTHRPSHSQARLLAPPLGSYLICVYSTTPTPKTGIPTLRPRSTTCLLRPSPRASLPFTLRLRLRCLPSPPRPALGPTLVQATTTAATLQLQIPQQPTVKNGHRARHPTTHLDQRDSDDEHFAENRRRTTLSPSTTSRARLGRLPQL